MADHTRDPGNTIDSKHSNALTNTVVQAGEDGRLNVYGAIVGNANAAAVYIQFFDKAAAGTVTLGTTVPDFVIMVPQNWTTEILPDRALKYFANGCRYAATTTATGSTAPAASVVCTIFYSQR
jgi:hypothetical protein